MQQANSQNKRKDYYWNTIGVLAQNAISPLLLILIARLNGVQDVGLFSFAFALALIFWAVSIWGARTYQVSDTKKEFDTRGYVTVRLLLSVAVLLVALIFCLINGYDYVKTTLIILLVFYKVLESVADAVYGVLQVNDRLYIVGKSLFYKATLGIILFTILDVITGSILISSLGLLIANLVVLVAYDISCSLRFDDIFPKTADEWRLYLNQAVDIIKTCAPIASIIFMSMFSLLIPRYFIDLYHQNEIGYFGILAMPITALGLLVVFIIQPSIVSISKAFFNRSKGMAVFESLVGRILLITFAVSILIIPLTYFIGVEVLTFIFGIDFSTYREILLIFAIGAIVNAFVTIFVNLSTIMRHFKLQFYTLLFSNIALVPLCFAFVPEFGMFAAVSLYLIANVIQLAVLLVGYRRLVLMYRALSLKPGV